MRNFHKIILGTAQFGFDYGISNKRGKIPETEVFQILDFAWQNGIYKLDTAPLYGESEKVIGKFIKTKKCRFDITSKVSLAEDRQLEKQIETSIKNLSTNYLDAYLFHNFDDFKNHQNSLEILQQYKKKGLIKKIGFSLYYPEELEYLWRKNIQFDIVQVPYNIFDQRFGKYFAKLQEKHTKVSVRSVFLQGLLLVPSAKIRGQFTKVKRKIQILEETALRLNVEVCSLCLNFAMINTNIDDIIIGVDGLSHFKADLRSLRDADKIQAAEINFLSLQENDKNIILPTKWEIKTL